MKVGRNETKNRNVQSVCLKPSSEQACNWKFPLLLYNNFILPIKKLTKCSRCLFSARLKWLTQCFIQVLRGLCCVYSTKAIICEHLFAFQPPDCAWNLHRVNFKGIWLGYHAAICPEKLRLQINFFNCILHSSVHSLQASCILLLSSRRSTLLERRTAAWVISEVIATLPLFFLLLNSCESILAVCIWKMHDVWCRCEQAKRISSTESLEGVALNRCVYFNLNAFLNPETSIESIWLFTTEPS